MQKKGRNRIVEIIDQITPDQGVFILRKLWNSSPDVRMKIETEIKKEFKTIDYNEVASEVQSSLDMLEEDELYDRSGPSRKGYHSPDDMAVIMVEEALEPYQEQLKRYFEMEMYKEAMEYCKGILKGLYEYEKNSNSKFSEWARDVPIEMFGWILREWKKKNKEKSYQVEIDEFITKECNEWSDHKG